MDNLLVVRCRTTTIGAQVRSASTICASESTAIGPGW